MSSSQVFVFGDQTGNFVTGLQQILLDRSNPLLVSFVERSYKALRQEVQLLPATEQHVWPSFTSISELLVRYQKVKPNVALESVLSCLYQLCCFIKSFGRENRPYPSGPQNHVVGLCVGSLAAAAVSSSQYLTDLLVTGVAALRVAMRVGHFVHRTSFQLDAQSIESTESWSYIIPSKHEEDVMKAISQAKLPKSRVPYFSAVGTQTITVSGPPSVLPRLLRETLPSTVPLISVPVHGPYHAPHIFSLSDVDHILSDLSALKEFTPRLSVLCTSPGQTEPATDFVGQLREAVQDIILRQLDLTHLTSEITKLVADASSPFTIVPISTGAGKGIVAAVQSATGQTCTVDNSVMDGVNATLTIPRACGPSGRPQDSKIAIVGMSGRFPDAADIDALWDLLYKGLDVHRPIPADRWGPESHYDPTGRQKNTSKVLNGCWIEEPGLFDRKFFNISPKEAAQTDPAQRLALATAYEALEMAGIVPDRTPSTRRDRVGVFYGATSDDWREINSAQNIDTYFIPGGVRAFTPGKLNYFFKFSGPSASVDTACSSSLAAINIACNALWNNDCDTVIAGGTNILTNPDNFAGLDKGHFLSHTGNCNAFDDAADGYCRADGIGTVVLKRLEDAEADNDPILGVILGAYTNHSAESVSITRPHAGAQQYIYSKLLTESGINPHDVGYVEMHGTGTQAGDATEMKSVLDTFAPDHARAESQSLFLGSVKSNIGHGESASGVIALIKVLLMMEKNEIPPHCGIKGKINRNFPTDLKERNVHIAFKPTGWDRSTAVSGTRRAMVNNFSAAGGNTALLIEDGPLPAQSGESKDARPHHVVTVSAKSMTSLKNNLRNLKEFVKQGQQGADFLAKLSYTTTARRMHHSFRVGMVAQDVGSLVQAIDRAIERQDIAKAKTVTPNVGFIFSGQGAQYSGMGKAFYENISSFKSDVISFDAICVSHGYPSILSVITGEADLQNASALVSQLGTVCLQMALSNFWISLGMKPAFVLGHSIGEYAALYTAGVLAATEVIYLTGARAQLLEAQCEAGTHAMLAVKAPLAQFQQFFDQTPLEVSCFNGPKDIVIGGEVAAIDELAQKLAGANIKATKLQVPYAFHSAQVKPILDDLQTVASGLMFRAPKIPVVSTLLGQIVGPEDAATFNPEYISRHCREAVNFSGAIQKATDEKLIVADTQFIELGPHNVCSNLLKANIGQTAGVVASLSRQEDGWTVLTRSLVSIYEAGHGVDWNQFHYDFKDCHEVLRLPRYSWDNENHWIQYVNDWTLTKGEASTKAPVSAAQKVDDFSTSSVHQLVQESVDGSVLTLIAQSDLGSPMLTAIAEGHRVNGAKLCTSSLYADIATTLGQRVLDKHRPDLSGYCTEVFGMAIDQPLIKRDEGQTLFRAEVTYDKSTLAAKMSIYSVDDTGRKTKHHANCGLRFENPNVWMEEWDRTHHLVDRSIEWLQKRQEQGFDTSFTKGMVYKLFSILVDYHDEFKGLQEVILNSDEYEATAKVKFQSNEGNFFQHPLFIDSCGQTTGFLMNGHQKTSMDQVFINHGWRSMKLAKQLSYDVTYRTYVRMRPVDGTKFAGDLYIIEDGVIVAVFGGMTFQGVPRRVLDTVLPPLGAKRATPAGRPAPAAKPAAVPAAATIQPVPAPATSAKSQMKPLLKILAEEIGLEIGSLTSDLDFIDYGVDSLISLTMAGRMREELGLDVESAIFTTCPTLGDLQKALAPQMSISVEVPAPAPIETFQPALAAPAAPAVTTHSQMQPVLAIMAEEIGLEIDTLTSDLVFTDYGVDSLISLTMAGRMREELGMDVESSIFTTCLTVGDLQRALIGEVSIEVPTHSSTSSEPDDQTNITTPSDSETESVVDVKKQKSRVVTKNLSQYQATSVLLQGKTKQHEHTLFLFPDGSGTASNYASIDAVLPESVLIYGLNCPWLKDADPLLEFGLQGLTSLYVAEIRSRQPHGPYNFGGWSAGGICAYEAAVMLANQGEVIENLILLDSPRPIGLKKLPPKLFDFLTTSGVFNAGTEGPPAWLIKHFLAFIEALDKWQPIPWPAAVRTGADAPKTHILWAEDGVCKSESDPRPVYSDDDPREMQWLLENRTDFSANRWDLLIYGAEISIERIPGANHFTMMKKGENTKALAAFLRGVFA